MMMYGNLGRVLTLTKKKDEILEAVSEVQVEMMPKKIIGRCGEAVGAVTGQGIDTLSDTTSSIGKGISKSFRKQSSHAHTLAREVADCVDPEDLIKAFRRLVNEDVQKNQQSVIHTPIDWAKRSAGSDENGEDDIRSFIKEKHWEETSVFPNRQVPSSRMSVAGRDGRIRRSTISRGFPEFRDGFQEGVNAKRMGNIYPGERKLLASKCAPRSPRKRRGSS